MFACSPIASFGIGSEIASAGATLNAFIILNKLMLLKVKLNKTYFKVHIILLISGLPCFFVLNELNYVIIGVITPFYLLHKKGIY